MSDLAINEFLKSGDIVRSRRYGSNEWNTNVIFDIKENEFVIDAGTKEETFGDIKEGNEFELRFTTKEFEYSIRACVVGVFVSPIQTVALRVEDIKKYNNMRKDLRHFVYLFALIRNKKNEKDPIFAVVTDISAGGVAVAVNDKKNLNRMEIKVGEELSFEVSLEDQRKLHFIGTIKRKKENGDNTEYGVQIKDIDKKNKDMLNDYVYELETADKEFQQLKQEIWEYNFGL
ncbi:MAG: PilZ domain-containing protein [Clostridiales bacterium]|nr:PilZ domain-containing protein [Clostridiales bacterium]